MKCGAKTLPDLQEPNMRHTAADELANDSEVPFHERRWLWSLRLRAEGGHS